MQDRIKKTLADWCSTDEFRKNKKELEHLQMRLDLIDDACISTIHSFAMKVIRESGLTLDVDSTSPIAPAPLEEIWWKSFSDALDTLSPTYLKSLLSEEWSSRLGELFKYEKFSEFVSQIRIGNNVARADKAGHIEYFCRRHKCNRMIFCPFRNASHRRMPGISGQHHIGMYFI